eukprot:Lithocolla_globosa_v1_NODE_641_length_3531_cov_128.763809.p4 type:complete len:190 gc:universal NODE_641_length_3531_cov_128.763809:2779-3348(+)
MCYAELIRKKCNYLLVAVVGLEFVFLFRYSYNCFLLRGHLLPLGLHSSESNAYILLCRDALLVKVGAALRGEHLVSGRLSNSFFVYSLEGMHRRGSFLLEGVASGSGIASAVQNLLYILDNVGWEAVGLRFFQRDRVCRNGGHNQGLAVPLVYLCIIRTPLAQAHCFPRSYRGDCLGRFFVHLDQLCVL